MAKSEETTITIPVDAFPSYKKGIVNTVKNPQTGDDEIESNIGSWGSRVTPKESHTTHTGATPMEERYSLEEWMGALEEVGYNMTEVYKLWRPEDHNAKRTGVIRTPKEQPKEKPIRKPKEAKINEKSIQQMTPDETNAAIGGARDTVQRRLKGKTVGDAIAAAEAARLAQLLRAHAKRKGKNA